MWPDQHVFVLDAYALLALIFDEPAAPRVQEILEQSARTGARVYISSVNLAEALYRVERKSSAGVASDALARIERLPLQIRVCDRDLAVAAAAHKARNPISLADCFVVALAQQTGGTIVTGDLDFQRFENIVTVEWLPRRT